MHESTFVYECILHLYRENVYTILYIVYWSTFFINIILRPWVLLKYNLIYMELYVLFSFNKCFISHYYFNVSVYILFYTYACKIRIP